MNTDSRSYQEKGKFRRRRRIIAAAALLLSLLATGCSGGAKAEETAQTMAAKESAPLDLETERETDLADKPGISVSEEPISEQPLEAETGNEYNTALSNPVKVVDSSADFKDAGLKLELPENESWSSGAVYSIIGGRVAQIQFHDEITGSDAIARAGKQEDGDISGIYYAFDDSKKQSWFTDVEDGTRVYITVQATSENSDVHGVLATWNYKDLSYSLWEDDAREFPDAVAKMAVEIMKVSDPGREEE